MRCSPGAALATLPYAIQVHPRIDDFAQVVRTGQTIPLIGLDLIGDRPQGVSFHSGQEGLSHNVAQELAGSNVWVSQSLGVKAGDQLALSF